MSEALSRICADPCEFSRAVQCAVQLGGVPETDARWFFQQFIIAVDYCHRLGIANRDIKVRPAHYACDAAASLLVVAP